MDESLKKLLFDIICRSVWGRELPDTQPLSDEQMQILYNIAKIHDLSHILTDGMMKTDIVPESFKGELKKSLLLAVMRYEKQKYTLNEISELFEQNEIPFIPLKGSVIRDYYPQPWMRTSGDIDVLVHKSDCEKAIKLIEEKLEYKLRQYESLHAYSLYSPSGVQLELHYTLVEDVEILGTNEILNSIWNFVTDCDGKKYMKKMPNEVFMLYHIVHIAKHFKGSGCGIRPFLDLWLLEQKMPFDRGRLDEMLNKSGILKFYDLSKQLCRVWFENDEHGEVTRHMEEFLLESGIHGNLVSRNTIRNAKGDSKIKAMMRLIFVPYEPLAKAYPGLKKRPYLYPFYQVGRWFKIFDRKKRRDMANQSRGIMSVSSSKADAVSKMLEEFGLK